MWGQPFDKENDAFSAAPSPSPGIYGLAPQTLPSYNHNNGNSALLYPTRAPFPLHLAFSPVASFAYGGSFALPPLQGPLPWPPSAAAAAAVGVGVGVASRLPMAQQGPAAPPPSGKRTKLIANAVAASFGGPIGSPADVGKVAASDAAIGAARAHIGRQPLAIVTPVVPGLGGCGGGGGGGGLLGPARRLRQSHPAARKAAPRWRPVRGCTIPQGRRRPHRARPPAPAMPRRRAQTTR